MVSAHFKVDRVVYDAFVDKEAAHPDSYVTFLTRFGKGDNHMGAFLKCV
jgi:hypothetical protein